MPRYIDADKLITYANNQKDKRIDANDIARFPTSDVRENVHGHWDVPTGYMGYKCSICGMIFDDAQNYGRYDPFCRECGARMDEVKDK